MLERDEFFARMQLHMADAKQEQKVGLVLARVQRLGEVNIVFDRELVDAASQRIKKALRAQDTLARVGECDFIMCLSALKNPGYAALAANSLVRAFEEPLQTQAGPVQVTMTIGISLFPDHGVESAVLCRHAEIAFSQALKSSDGYCVYDSHEERIEILYPELREAISNNRLDVYFQPFWDLRKKKIVGAESLVRWKNDRHGLVGPDHFIPFAEQTGLISALTRWSVNATLHQFSPLHLAGRNLSVAINLSARVFHEQGIVEQILGALKIFDVPATSLVVEVTESAIMTDLKLSARVLESLRENGARVSIDDFGCGYSSFEYLKKFPATELKIDKSFVFDITRSRRASQLVMSMIDLAHNLDIVATAEGVEDQETADLLSYMDCDFAQGYFFGRPKPAEEFIREILNSGP